MKRFLSLFALFFISVFSSFLAIELVLEDKITLEAFFDILAEATIYGFGIGGVVKLIENFSK